MVRKKLTLLVDEELVRKARDPGFNISRLTEKAIEETINRLDSIRAHTYDNRANVGNSHSENKSISNCLGAGDGSFELDFRLSNPRPLDYESNA